MFIDEIKFFIYCFVRLEIPEGCNSPDRDPFNLFQFIGPGMKDVLRSPEMSNKILVIYISNAKDYTQGNPVIKIMHRTHLFKGEELMRWRVIFKIVLP